MRQALRTGLDYVGSPRRHSLYQTLITEPADCLPGRGPPDLKLGHQFRLGRYAFVLRVLARLDPSFQDLAYLSVGRYPAARIDHGTNRNHTVAASNMLGACSDKRRQGKITCWSLLDQRERPAMQVQDHYVCKTCDRNDFPTAAALIRHIHEARN